MFLVRLGPLGQLLPALSCTTPENRRLKNYQHQYWFRQKRCQSLAPVLVIIFGNSLVFSRKNMTSTGFYRCCAPRRCQSLAPVLVIISGNSLVFSRKSMPSTGFYWCCAPGASATAMVEISLPEKGILLGQPICRTKLPRKALISKRKMVRKTTRNFPEKF